MYSRLANFPRSLKTAFAAAWKTCAAIFALLLLYGAAAWGLGNWKVQQRAPLQSGIAVYIISNGVHTDIALPIETPQWHWRDWVRETDTRQMQLVAQYVAIGWGDRGFYLETPTWADLKASTSFKAISGLNQTSMHVTFYAHEPLEEPKRSLKIIVSPEEYQRLAQQISQSFATKQGKTQPITGAHYHETDAFYEANGRYSAFKTCNTWTNSQFKNSGLPARFWTPFSGVLVSP
ncbi:TIGR02117 family protein [Kingella negevensis]|uniref:TIGR02117 family protein n=1 Tax=Kingella negevensis TaxID=1522312 RepID=UPI002543424C|nr:TIGR02117 family protein [Kingella negevensis]WII92219.1 TIGR02117 family protein [Kingella negevensis]